MNEKETKQELFDISYKHVMEQGKPSVDRSLGCWYRYHGLSCGAAPFIKEYDEGMEGYSWEEVAWAYPENLDARAVEFSGFVESLQSAHDEASTRQDFMDAYRLGMRNIAQKHGLTMEHP